MENAELKKQVNKLITALKYHIDGIVCVGDCNCYFSPIVYEHINLIREFDKDYLKMKVSEE